MSGYHGKKRYWCVTCKRGVTKSQKVEHTHAGHVLVGRSRKKRKMLKPLIPEPPSPAVIEEVTKEVLDACAGEKK